jgi:hypothetical protein
LTAAARSVSLQVGKESKEAAVNEKEAFREMAEETLGLAVSVFTIYSEDPQIARELLDEADPMAIDQALHFLCLLLSRYMTPEQVRAEMDALIVRGLRD